MRLAIIIFSIVSLFICALYENNRFTKREAVKWNERNQLYASDFVALAKPYQKEHQHRHLSIDSTKLLKNYAWISSSINIKKLSNTDSLNIAVFTEFNPNESYYFDHKDTLCRDLITHEEYHFHIAEVVSRKVRREILNSLDVLSKDLINSILSTNKILLDSLDNAYDTFANHGTIESKQIQYQSKIDSMLAYYAAYSDPYIRNYKQGLTKHRNQLLGNSLYKTQPIRKDSLLIATRKESNDTINLYRYKFMPLLAVDHLNIKNGQLQRVKAFFVNNGLFDPDEVGKSVSYSMQFKQNALDEAPHQYIPLATIQDTAYISFIVNEDLKRLAKKEKFLSVVYRFNLNGKDTTFVSSYSFTVLK